MREIAEIKKEDPESYARANYVDKVGVIPDKVRDGILEKWLGYTKSYDLTLLMLWRLQCLQFNFSYVELTWISLQTD